MHYNKIWKNPRQLSIKKSSELPFIFFYQHHLCHTQITNFCLIKYYSNSDALSPMTTAEDLGTSLLDLGSDLTGEWVKAATERDVLYQTQLQLHKKIEALQLFLQQERRKIQTLEQDKSKAIAALARERANTKQLGENLRKENDLLAHERIRNQYLQQNLTDVSATLARLAKKEARLAKKDAQLGAKDARLAEQDAQLGAKDALLNSYGRTLREFIVVIRVVLSHF